MKKFLALILSALLAAGLCGCAPSGGGDDPPGGQISAEQKELNEMLAALSEEEFTYSQLMGTDSLGRRVEPTAGVENKYVGIFYFVNLGASGHNKIYDISKLLERYGSETENNPLFALPDSAAYDAEISPYTSFHYWGEPLYGYYKSEDEWVIRRQMELFMQAGIDFLYLDYSNSTYEYSTAVQAILKVILELQEEGYENVPLLTFMLPDNESDSAAKVSSLYENWYTDSKYKTCWFRGDREINPAYKPMVVGHFSKVTDEKIQKNLWLKEMQWPSDSADENSFPWIEWNEAGTSQPNHGGTMNVSVAQHVRSWSSTSYLDSLKGGHSYAYRARGWTENEPNEYGVDPDNVLAGTNFEFQWKNALNAKDDLNMVTITGWNEWAAPKISYSTSYAVFNDLFNCAFSRDAEMMKGGYGDNYYMQIARNVRNFKGKSVNNTDNVALFEKASVASAADVSALPAVFCDVGADAAPRTSFSVGDIYDYTDRTDHNNIVKVLIGNDENNLYVAVICKEKITERAGNDENWMNVYLSCGGKGWENYDFVVGRGMEGNSARVEKFTGVGSAASAVGNAVCSVSDKTVLYQIPLSLLGVREHTVVGVKATDNLQKFGDIDDFYYSGDSAPLGRLNYAYKIA